MGRKLFLAGAATLLAACGGGGVDNPPNGTIRAVHLAAQQGTINFLRVERAESSLAYKQDSGFISVDEDTYNFNVEILPPGTTDPERILTFPFSVTAGQSYTFFIRDAGGGVRVETLEHAENSAGSGETLIDLLHAAPNLPAVDVFLEAPGTPLNGATPLDSLNFNDQSEGLSRPEGDYQLSLTASGDPSALLFTSETVALPGEARLLFIVTDTAGDTTEPFSVLLLSDGTLRDELFDVNALPAMRIVHGASNLGAIDVVVDDDFTNPFAAAVQPDSITDYSDLSPDATNLKVTPAGNSGTLEIDNAFTIPQAQRVSLLVSGSSGAVQAASVIDEFRAIPGAARVRIYSAQEQEGNVNVYIVPPGTDLADTVPSATASFPGIGPYLDFLPGDYQLRFTEFSSDDPIGVATDITLEGGMTYGILVLDDPTARVRAVLFDGFAP